MDTSTPDFLARAREILAAPMGTLLHTPDGALRKSSAGWSPETCQRVNSAFALAGSAEWRAAMGPHEHATLTADGRGTVVTGWCGCARGRDAAKWVRYERWTTQGRVAHGYVCPGCRHLTQTG